MNLSINNVYNAQGSSRFYAPTCIYQADNCLQSLVSLLHDDRPTYLIVDALMYERIIPGTLLENFNVLKLVANEPTETDIVDAVSRIQAASFNLVAVGGGSTIDTAKAVFACSLFNEWKRIGYGDYRYVSDGNIIRPGRFIAVPTLPASGTETSRYYLVKDCDTGDKLVSRSWHICPDVALLDPTLLHSAPMPLLVCGAFDAFSHCWETFHCRFESTHLIRVLAEDAIRTIIPTLKSLSINRANTVLLAKLQYAASIGGVCISNVRTGLLHTAGEALSAQIELAHPLTLYIFFRRVVAGYIDKSPINSVGDDFILDYWERIFVANGLVKKIEQACFGRKVNLQKLMKSISSDKVLLEKEHPVPIPDMKYLEEIIVKSLEDFSISYE